MQMTSIQLVYNQQIAYIKNRNTSNKISYSLHVKYVGHKHVSYKEKTVFTGVWLDLLPNIFTCN